MTTTPPLPSLSTWLQKFAAQNRNHQRDDARPVRRKRGRPTIDRQARNMMIYIRVHETMLRSIRREARKRALTMSAYLLGLHERSRGS